MDKKGVIIGKTADTLVKVCYDIVQFSRLYEEDHPESAERLFQCNDQIKMGLRWFIGSENTRAMHSNIGAYIQSVETTLKVYNNLNLPFENRGELISTLRDLRSHLSELQKQIGVEL